VLKLLLVWSPESKRKKAEDAAALQKALEIAKEIEVPASSIAKEDADNIAQEVVKATEAVQELATSEGGNMLMTVKAEEDVKEDNTAEPEAVDEQGNLDLSYTNDVINVESDSTQL
jgi:hypothetical protein